jgi:hypothetical protein
MNNPHIINSCPVPKPCGTKKRPLRLFSKLTIAGSALALLATSAQAQQTVSINPITINYWVGVNTTNVLGVGSNSVAISGTTSNLVNLNLSSPANVGFVLTPPATTTGLTNLGVALFVTNAPAGVTPLIISGSGGADYSTNVNLFSVPQWISTNSASSGNWSSTTNWSGGAVPGLNGSVYFENNAIAPFTNVVDSSQTLQSLIYLGDADDNLSLGGVYTLIPAGVTLSVVGTNGFAIGVKSNNDVRPQYVFYGGGALVVNNANANFAINDGCSSSSTRVTTVTMSGLSNFVANVSRFGAGDATLSAQGLVGGALVTLNLARTNTITTTWTDNYSALGFQNSFNAGNNGEEASGSATTFLNLGLTNGIYTDSIGVGRSHMKGTSGVGETMRFPTTLTNSAAPVASVYIRGATGGRMSLLAVGVDSGTNNSTVNTIGSVDLLGGNVDMLVDQIWLGRNRTNTVAPTDSGSLSFDNGTVSANTIEDGYMEYTNSAVVKGNLLVGTNALLIVANYLELGHTPVDPAGSFAVPESLASGQMIIGGGTALVNQIIVGTGGGTNIITINTGGSLVVTNTIASPTNGLSTLALGAGQLTFFVQAGVTNAFVTNLVTSATCNINIASLTGFSSYPATNVLIAYQTPGTHTLGIGSLPSGFNNLQLIDDPVSMTIRLIISTNQPENLAWRGGQNSQWDHSSLNWLNTNTLAITKFTDGDNVTFDDTAAVPTNITVAEAVNPSQTGTGIFVTSSTNQFTFNNFGSGYIGSCALTQSGASTLEIDCLTSIAAQINAGSLVGVGTLNSVAINSNATLDFNGNIGGSLTTSGTATLGANGTLNGPLTINYGVTTNAGLINGPLTMGSATLLYNSGTFSALGTATVVTNSILINAGSLYGTSLTVNFGGSLMDDVQGYAGSSSPGSINVGSLVIGGTFIPGGGTTGTTKVTDYLFNGSEAGSPSGRVQLNTGSTTYFEVNLTNAQANTLLLSQNQGFGPSQPNKSFNGATIVIDNIGPTPFAAGQTFQLFGNYYTGGSIFGAGLNTTNSYPVISPAKPGPGLVWDLSQLIPGGIVGVTTPAQISLANNTIVGTSNIVSEFTWPANYLGGWLQQMNTTLTNGLTATNWVTVAGSSSINDIFVTNNIIADPNAVGSAIFFRFVYP